MINIPSNWRWVTLNDLQADEPRAITDGPFGSNLTSAHYTDSGPRVVRLQNIGDGKFIGAEAHISGEHFKTLRAHEVLPGDLLIASLGEAPPRGCLAPHWLGPAIVKADCVRVRLSPSVEPRWVLYALQAPAIRRWATEKTYGVGRPRLGLKTIRRIPIPLPPLDEQRRIVEILEDHLSRLDAAEDALRTAARRVETLRQSVLVRLPWEPRRPLAELAEIQGGIQKQPKRKPSLNPYPFLRVANVTSDGLDLSEIHQIELFDGDLERWRLLPGDLLVVEGNGSPSQIGRAATWDGSIPDCVHQNHLIRVRPGPDLLPAFLEAAWNSPWLRGRLTDVASSTSGLYTLSVAKLSRLEVPTPPLDQQAKATERLWDLEQSIGRLRWEARSGLVRATQLRTSLLQAAFSGRVTGARVSIR